VSSYPTEWAYQQACARAEAAVAERDKANVEWHRIRDLHAAAIRDLREQVEEGERMLQEQRDLLAEVDCRIEHGAESGGHLEYVRTYLRGCASVLDGCHDPRDPNVNPIGAAKARRGRKA
jgi:hypothetical protein